MVDGDGHARHGFRGDGDCAVVARVDDAVLRLEASAAVDDLDDVRAAWCFDVPDCAPRDELEDFAIP